jgi:hypothetical protein
MNKTLVAVLTVVLIFAFTACGTPTPAGQEPMPAQESQTPASEAASTVQSLQAGDIVGIWQIGEFDDEKFVLIGEFIEFTETEMITLKDGMREPYTLEDSRMVLGSADYMAALAEDEDVLLLAPENTDDPIFLAQRSSAEKMEAYAAEPKVIDRSSLTGKEWNYTDQMTAPGADTAQMPLYECGYILFGEDGSFRTSHAKGTYEVKDDTLTLLFTAAGQQYVFTITIDGQPSKGVYDMILTSEDNHGAFLFRAYEER